LVYPLWNHRGPRPPLEAVLDRVKLDHLTIPAVGGPAAQFRYFEAPDHPYFNTEGGWHYQPDEKLYAGCPVSPLRADWLGDENPFDDVVRILRERSMRLAVRVGVTRIPRLWANAPRFWQRDAWGQWTHIHPACPNQAAVRDLLLAIIRDLDHYQPTVVQLQEFGPCGFSASALYHGWDHAPSPCFCDACRATAVAAGLNPDDVAACARDHEGSLISHTRDEKGELAIRRDERLSVYQMAQTAEHAAWLNQFAAQFPRTTFMLEGAFPFWLKTCEIVDYLDPQRWVAIRAHAFVMAPANGGVTQDPDHMIPVTLEGKKAFLVPGGAARLDSRYAPAGQPGQAFERLQLRIEHGTAWFEFEPTGDGAPDELDQMCRAVAAIREAFARIPQTSDGATRHNAVRER
jgi:hypothetical protein